MSSIVVELDNFKNMNYIEELFAKDDLEAVKQLEIDFGPRFSEVSVHFGSKKCLQYLIDGGYELSPLINLYLIKKGEMPIQEVSHDSELYTVFTTGRTELLPLTTSERLDYLCKLSLDSLCKLSDISTIVRIERPSISVAFKTLVRLMNYHAFDMIDYASKIYSFYSDFEWKRFIEESGPNVIRFLMKYKLCYFLKNAQLSNKVLSFFKRLSKREFDLIEKYCSIPILYQLYMRDGIDIYRNPLSMLRNRNRLHRMI